MLGIFLDQETTGLDPYRHCVVELALKIVDLSQGKTLAEYDTTVKISKEEWANRDPESVKVNGFQWEETQKGKEAETIGREIIELFTRIGIQRGKAVFICQNPSFDRAFFFQFVDIYTHERLQWPYHWLDLASMYWTEKMKSFMKAGEEIPKELLLSKDAIAQAYVLPPEAKPHRAMNGVDHLISCYNAVINFELENV